MIQRIQTVFLLLTVACLATLFAIPLGHLVIDGSTILEFNYQGISESELVANSYSVLPLTVLMGLTTAISFLSILLFKRRVLQIRLNGINIFLMIGQIGIYLFYFFNAAKQINAEKQFSIAIILPVIAIILTYLAIRAIGKDEALVKAADRIR